MTEDGATRATTEYDGFRVERDEGRQVATITLDVPGKLNRVPLAARAQLARVFAELGEDEGIRFVVLTGAGGAFTAGGDIGGFLQASPEELSRLAWDVAAPERCPKPVIAAIRGYCLGVGLELALACDFRFVGLSRAKDVIMRRKRISAADALAWGLVSEVVPGDELEAAVDRAIAELAELSPLALAMAKRVLNHVYDGPLHLGLELEGLAYGLLRSTHDFREGVEAFVEKRKPRFQGR